MEKNIAFFDFDGTITSKDTMLELARYSSGNLRYLVGMMQLAPVLLAMKISLVSKTVAKERFLQHFFGEMDIRDFDEKCRLFSEQRLPALMKPEAMAVLEGHLAAQTPVVVVSASAENWVAPWCRQRNLGCIASRMELKNERLTGRLQGENCNGIEKVSRIKELFNLADFTNIYCYGDTEGDREMLAIATHPFYQCYQ